MKIFAAIFVILCSLFGLGAIGYVIFVDKAPDTLKHTIDKTDADINKIITEAEKATKEENRKKLLERSKKWAEQEKYVPVEFESGDWVKAGDFYHYAEGCILFQQPGYDLYKVRIANDTIVKVRTSEYITCPWQEINFHKKELEHRFTRHQGIDPLTGKERSFKVYWKTKE